MNEHEQYGVEKLCGECRGETFIAKQYTSSPIVPSHVQARCKQLACTWRGRIVGLSKSSSTASVAEETVGELF